MFLECNVNYDKYTISIVSERSYNEIAITDFEELLTLIKILDK